jgi:hypothetical protein
VAASSPSSPSPPRTGSWCAPSSAEVPIKYVCLRFV